MVTMKPMKFTLPEHNKNVQGLGYANGLSDGIFEGMLPVVAYGPTSTNDPEQFKRLFDEGYQLGYAFGEYSRQQLRSVLVDTILPQWWWPVCIAFAGQHQGLEGVEELTDQDRCIEQGMREFERIFQEYLYRGLAPR